MVTLLFFLRFLSLSEDFRMISRASIHQAIRAWAPLAGLSDQPVKYNGLTTDAGETAFFELGLTDIATQMYNQKYPALNMREIVSVKTDINPGADFHIWRGYDYDGDVVETEDYDDELPEVELKGMQAAAQRITGIMGSYGFSIMDGRRAQMAGLPLDTMKAFAAREVMEKKLDKMMAIGSFNRANNGIYGFFNHPAITSTAGTNSSVNTPFDVSAQNTGAGQTGSPLASSTGVDWGCSLATGKTVSKVIADLNLAFNTAQVNTNYVHEPDTLTLDKKTFQAWNQTPANFGDIALYNTSNYMSYIRSQCGWLKNVKQTLQANFAAGTALTAGTPTGTPLAVLHEDKRENAEFLFPQPFEQFPPQLKGMKFSIACHMRVGGQIIRRPGAFILIKKPQG